MTDTELHTAMTEAAAMAAKQALALQAAAFTQAVQPRSPKHVNPWTIAALAIALVIPIAGWVNSVSSRVSVLEAALAPLQVKVESLNGLSTQLAAVKQELSDFRSEFRDWKRENGFGTPLRPRMDPH